MFATYLHPETIKGSRPVEEIHFVGHSVPYFATVRQALAERLGHYPAIPLRQAKLDDYLTVHTPAYLNQLTTLAAGGRPERPPRLSPECAGFAHFLPGYLYGLGGMLEAIDRFRNGELAAAYCFSLPGHHAFPDWGHGYCLLNPLAAVVRYAQGRGFDRVLVVDWDLHHGDGTQAIFANDPTVFCLSIHSALDLYMAKVSDWRAGTVTLGARVGHCNLPVLHERLIAARETTFGPYGGVLLAAETIPAFAQSLERLPFPPDLICIFSGYDAHKDDCGRKVTNWTETDFVHLTRVVMDLATRCGCPILSVHGGGYRLETAVESAGAHVATLSHYRATRGKS